MPLTLTATEEERQFLLKLSNSNNLQDVDHLIKSIPLVPQSGTFTYISVALTKLIALWQSETLFDNTHKETWYQMHVYGDLLDGVFLFDKNYNIKRSECHASTIKYLKKNKLIKENEKDVKVDLILFNRGYGDVFTCEDKPESASDEAVQDDIEKGSVLREKRLFYLKSIIPYQPNLSHVEVLSAQFHGLQITIYGSKFTELGDIVHYQKAKTTVPTSPQNLSQAAHFLLTIISLQRNISMGLKKLEIIFDTYLQDTVEYLVSPINIINNNLVFREDSPSSDCSGESTRSIISNDWELAEQERRIVKLVNSKIGALDFGESILTGGDWEELLDH